MSGVIALGVPARVLMAMPEKPEGRWARWRQHRHAPRGYVWEADAADAFVDATRWPPTFTASRAARPPRASISVR